MTKKRKFVHGWLNIVSLYCIIFVLQFVSVIGLQGLKIFVPEAVIVHSNVTLACQYDLEKASLYSVKWYFESEEFYRYIPTETPPGRIFYVPGILVEPDRSDSTSVTLKDVTRDVSGVYQCEVSEDAPLFHTDIRQAKMQVVELPDTNPAVTLVKRFLNPSETLRAYCTVGTSYPTANITWYINGRRVYKTPHQRISYQIYENKGITSGLEVFPLSQILQDVFQSTTSYQSNFDVMCEVSIFHIYNKNAIERVYFGDPSASVSPNLLNWEDATHPLRNGNSNQIIVANILSYVILIQIFQIIWSRTREISFL
uniref:CSON011055 protein n=1 Tax=Culicoides sonorensis TaxID=179676 RepID=A0A336M3G1_CULSO